MDPLVLIVIVVAGVILALAAYGTWLIGRGTDAEFQARAKAGDSAIVGSGWFLLDWARTADLPYLGSGQDGRTYRCSSCRHTWTHTGRGGWPACPNCGTDETRPVD